LASCGTQSKYGEGCRCKDCRDAHATVTRERRQRRKAGIIDDSTRVPPDKSRQAIQWMRDGDLRWHQIEALTGFQRVSLQRIMKPEKRMVAHSTERVLRDTVDRLKADPRLLTRDVLLLPARYTRWQIHALMAQGWRQDDIERLAKISLPRSHVAKVQTRIADVINKVFMDKYGTWGPSRTGAKVMWRQGKFMADCYLWEDGDLRPIPGSLHPDLVLEALDYTRMHRNRVDPTRQLLRESGQWSTAICARTSMRNWCEVVGAPMEDYVDEPLHLVKQDRSKWCGNYRHDHSVPECWTT
jgi:hypothetical protein